MSLPKEGSREIAEGIIVSEPHDWCKSPSAPVPYKIWARQLQAADLADTVRQTDERSHVKGSLVLASYGDEPGTGGGVRSGTRGAECTPKTWSATVRAQDRPMVRHDDEWWMNHRNTYGRLAYVKDPKGYDTPEPKDVKPRMQLAQAAAAPAAGGAVGALEALGGGAGAGTAILEAAPPVAIGTGVVVGAGAVGLGAAGLAAAGHNAHMTILEGPNLSAPGPPTAEQIDKYYSNNQAQALAKAQVKPVSWVRITQNPCAKYACGVTGSPYRGGTYLCTKGGATESHHTPAASVSYLPYSAGPAIQMDPADHADTASYGSSMQATMYRAQQSAAISNGNFMGAVTMDVNDVKSKFGSKYDGAILQMLTYANCLKTNGYVR